MCVCVVVVAACGIPLISPIHSGPEREREMPRALYSHAVGSTHTHTLAIISFASPNLGVISSRPPGHRKKEERKEEKKNMEHEKKKNVGSQICVKKEKK